jgi:membrane protease YdiL (CAAX protease family)
MRRSSQQVLPSWGKPETFFALWVLLALASLFPVVALLDSSFPVFTVLWLVLPLAAVLRSQDAGQVGVRPVPWKLLARITGINLFLTLSLMVIFEPWSHTYRMLVEKALSGARPDSTFAWLARYPGPAGWSGMLVFSGLVTLFGEELFFRGWLLRWLQRRMKPFRAIVTQATLFTLPQLIAALFLPTLQGVLYAVIYAWLGIGVINGWAACRTQSIWPGLVSATLVNFILTGLLR